MTYRMSCRDLDCDGRLRREARRQADPGEASTGVSTWRTGKRSVKIEVKFRRDWTIDVSYGVDGVGET